jgi:hypothetical protein
MFHPDRYTLLHIYREQYFLQQAVLTGRITSAGHTPEVPEQNSSSSHDPIEGLQTVLPGEKESAGQVADDPEQLFSRLRSALSPSEFETICRVQPYSPLLRVANHPHNWQNFRYKNPVSHVPFLGLQRLNWIGNCLMDKFLHHYKIQQYHKPHWKLGTVQKCLQLYLYHNFC